MISKYVRGSQTLRVFHDDNPINPRKEFDNLGTMICFHGRYDLGDAHKMTVEAAKALEDGPDVVAIPLYLYDHSGITIRTTPFSCPWDSGKVGFIYVTKDRARKEFSWKTLTAKRVARVLEVLKDEVEVYDHYLKGNTYGFTIVEDGKETDSCWGFYGPDPVTNGIFDHVGPGWTVVDRKTA